jgi:hypothetical protein
MRNLAITVALIISAVARSFAAGPPPEVRTLSLHYDNGAAFALPLTADSKSVEMAAMCRAVGSAWDGNLRKVYAQLDDQGHTLPPWDQQFHVVIMTERGGVCYESRTPYVAGNPIFTGLIAKNKTQYTDPVFNPCGLDSATPPVNGTAAPAATPTTGPSGKSITSLTSTVQFQAYTEMSERLGHANLGESPAPAPSESKSDDYSLIVFDPHRCFASSVSLQIAVFDPAQATPSPQSADSMRSMSFLPAAPTGGKGGGTGAQASAAAPAGGGGGYTIEQYTRFAAGLQLGVVSSHNVDGSFDLANGVIVNKNAKSAHQFFAAVVLYGIPNYFKWRSSNSQPGFHVFSTYRGRDLLHDKSALDRTGLILGTSLTDPTKRVYGGLTFEILPAIDLVVSYELAHVQALNGVTLGAPFTSTPSTIPTRDATKKSVVFGLSFDPSYVTALIHK